MKTQIGITEALSALADEIARARERFALREKLGEALGEEVGEWAQSDAQDIPGNIEALHVACVAMRIYMEGSTPLNIGVFTRMLNLEKACRPLLEKNGLNEGGNS